MIINHRYRFIFLKTVKTAGTSVEIALSKFCTPEDVITPITDEDEQLRRALGYQGPVNCLVPFRRYSVLDWSRFLATRRRLGFFNHAPAKFVRQHVEPDVWNTYFKFTVERNPFDKVVSKYYWDYRGEPPLTLDEWIRQGKGSRIPAFDIYSLNGEVAVDRILRFEKLTEELDEITRHLGLPEPLQLPRAKGSFRKDRRHYREIMGEEGRRRLAAVYARELALLDYSF
jgi:Sulfotransferase family